MTDINDNRYGDWAQTFSGKRFYALDPRPEDFDIRVVARALSQINRFGGHTLRQYNVADHSIRVAHTARRLYVDKYVKPSFGWKGELEGAIVFKCGLLHEVGEAYIGDMVRPMKYSNELKAFRDIENKILSVASIAFDSILDNLPYEVKLADNILLVTEKRDLMAPCQWGDWINDIEVLPDIIYPMTSLAAERLFLSSYDDVNKEIDELKERIRQKYDKVITPCNSQQMLGTWFENTTEQVNIG